MYFKTADSPQFQKVTTNTGIASLVSGTIILTEVPTVLRLQVNQIFPNPSTVTKKVLLDGKQILSTDPNNFEFTISDSQAHQATLVIEDTPSGAKTEINIPIQVNRADVIGKIIVTPGTVGSDPFNVTFDASTSILNDTGDEIVYFTWDF